MSGLGLTQKQTWAFFKAAQAGAAALGIDRETYRHQVMHDEAGTDSLKQLDRKADFENCMARFWSDAGDFEMASHYMAGDARRLGLMCEVCASQIAQIAQIQAPGEVSGGKTAPYVLGVLHQAGYRPKIEGAAWFLDVPEGSLHRVFCMLDTHRRRLLRAAGARFPFTFHIDASYRHSDDGTITIQLKATPPDSLTVRST